MDQLYDILLSTQFLMAAVVVLSLFWVSAPYGKFLRAGWGPTIPSIYAWIIMELPAVAVITWQFLVGTAYTNWTLVIFLVVWQTHYLHRTFFYPFTLKNRKKPYPFSLVLMAIVFNSINGFINGYYLFHLSSGYNAAWFTDPRFIAGITLFYSGFLINKNSDRILGSLRGPGETDYKIPHGGLFKWVSCPNYLGEILEWCGWAIMTWSLPGLAFAVFTAANLLPRAVSHHKWYKQHFENYPPDRKALIPYLL